MAKLVQYFWALAEQLPSLLAMAGGIVFALTRWRRHPRVSLLVVLALGLMLLHVFVFLIVYDVVPPIFLRSMNALTTSYEAAASARRNVFLILGLVYNGTLAVPFALLLLSAFMGRSRPNPMAHR
jgi:hypothetical protein